MIIIKSILVWVFIITAIIGIMFASISFIIGFICRYIYGGFWKGYFQAEKDFDITFLDKE